ncbi:Lysine-specific metallo-endopeptidase [Cnuella takakiae]|uniref:Lysine-specific metallo-endopeptidase n=1 Tax=Cnuella takakiae TaxID=1302690 RepID=A0A1M5CGY7_9BACT|nr:M35 family metallo-endopeptidase [Cnuella takakiae]OLY91818.1 hypothetical protein BUE76_07835 [Cnuella takakiae]SHF53941.1 Lysine-specific metallo-endopeptidase [Cnuella takakiae]
MPSIQTRIIAPQQVNADGPVMVTFELTNNGPDDAYVLKRDMPLEGLKSDCLDVRVNGEKVLYDGYFLKRSEANMEDFVLVKAGQTISETFDISLAYDMSTPGTYEIRFDGTKLVVISAEARKRSMHEAKAAAALTQVENVPGVLSQESNAVRQTIGAAMRTEAKKKRVGTEGFAMGLRKPAVKGANATQKTEIEAAHKAGYDYTIAAIGQVDNNNTYKLWFGEYTAARAGIVKDNYAKIKQRMETVEFTYDLTGSECTDDTFAYTTIGGSTIWLCGLFWAAPPTGFDSKAGTVVHEHSHASARTEDLIYRQDPCKELARTNPAKAIKNADNHEYFTEDVNTIPLSPFAVETILSENFDYLTVTPNETDDEYALEEMEFKAKVDGCMENPRPWYNWRPAESIKHLLAQLNNMAPGRSKEHDGTIGDSDHEGRNSDHNPWVKDEQLGIGVVTAVDITHDPAHKCDCNVLVSVFEKNKDPRIKYVIWNRKIMNSSAIGGNEPWRWRPYYGKNPHNLHMHVSVKCDRPSYDSTVDWLLS